VDGRPGVRLDRDVGAHRADARQRDEAAVARREHAAPPHLAEDEPDHPGVDVGAGRVGTRGGHDLLVLRARVGLAGVAVGPFARVHCASKLMTPMARSWSTTWSAAASGSRVVVSTWTSGSSGGSYGESMPVKFTSSPRRACA